MKRGAEKYLSKDDVSEDEEEIEPSPQGFQKADDAILATRKIRALPKRSRLSTPPSTATSGPTTPEPATATPKFAGFTGFGAPLSSQSEPPLSFGTTAAAPTPSTAPAVAPTASNAAKTFASFLGTPPSPFLPKSSQETSAAKRSPEPKSDSDDSAALKYYTALRGLNVSFLSTLSKVTEDDPFADASTVFERYTSYRRGIQKEFDDSKRETVPTPALPMKATMPAPPVAFSFGNTPTPSTHQNGSNGPTAKPSSASAPSSGFSFSFPPQPFGTNLPAPTTGITPTESSSSATSKPQAPSTPFSFSSPSPSAPTPFKFGGTSTTSGPFTFGGSSSTSISASADNKPSTTSTPFTFGVQSTTTTSKDKPSTVPFGTPQLSTAPFGTFGGFGKSPVGSIGNPVGFGFGSSSKPNEDSSVTGEELAPASTSETEKGEIEDAKEGGAKTEVAANSFLTTSPHDVEGEGEEDEETLHSVKLKAYRLKKAGEPGGTGWVELGYGVLRVKKHKETDARRLLLRNSANGKVNINFNLYPGMVPSRNKKTVAFVGHDSGVAQTYSVRLQTEEQATKLKDVLDREIALVKTRPDA